MRAHSANFTRSVKHTFDHIYSHITGQFTTPSRHPQGDAWDTVAVGWAAARCSATPSPLRLSQWSSPPPQREGARLGHEVPDDFD
jgi:hypothetical protein